MATTITGNLTSGNATAGTLAVTGTVLVGGLTTLAQLNATTGNFQLSTQSGGTQNQSVARFGNTNNLNSFGWISHDETDNTTYFGSINNGVAHTNIVLAPISTGKVGIGKKPTQTLDVSGSGRFSTSLMLDLQNSTPSVPTGSLKLFANSSGSLVVVSGSGNSFTIPYLENVNNFSQGIGIGTSNIGIRKLYVIGDIESTTKIVLPFLQTDIVGTYSNSDLIFRGANTDALKIFGTTRNILIQNGGTFTDNGERLQVNGGARITSRLDLGVDGTGQGYLRFFNSATTAGLKYGNIYNDNTNGGLHFDTGANAYPIQIDGSKLIVGVTGNVLVNTTTDAGFKLDINGTGRFSDNITLSNDKIIGNTSGYFFTGTSGVGINSTNGLFFQIANSTKLAINSVGNVGIGTTSPNKKLEIANAGEASIRLNNTNTNFWDIINTTSSGALEFNRGGSVFASISASGVLNTGKLGITTGSNASTGTATLIAGTVTVSTTAVKSGSLVWVQYHGSAGMATSVLTVPTITDSTSFVITAITAGATTTNVTDTNTVKWWIIN